MRDTNTSNVLAQHYSIAQGEYIGNIVVFARFIATLAVDFFFRSGG